jgi:hypothetical protein
LGNVLGDSFDKTHPVTLISSHACVAEAEGKKTLIVFGFSFLGLKRKEHT